MSAIEFTTGTYRSRVDGTLVLQVEIEPRNVTAALQLFGLPGTPGAMARLVTPADEPKPKAKPVVGQLCLLAVRWCESPEFWNWLESPAGKPSNEAGAKAVICFVCRITSRKELDTNPEAAALFEKHFRKPFAKHLKDNGLTI